MPQNWLKPLRVLLALFFFLATALLFLDFSARLPADGVAAVHYLQFVPSLIQTSQAVGWAGAGLLFVLLLTLLFGRVFCSTICPFGTLQDILYRLVGQYPRNRKRVRFRYHEPHPVLRHGILLATVISALGGSLLVLAQLDPYSHFGRFMGLVLRPLLVAINNLAAWLLEQGDLYLLAPLDFALLQWQTALVPLALLLILVLTVRRGRLFCNTLCPVGTLLGLVARVALFRIRIDRERCSLCAECAIECKAECIHLRSKRVDFSRCVACFNCLPACPEAGIGYRRAWWHPRERPEPPAVAYRSRHARPGPAAGGLEADTRDLRWHRVEGGRPMRAGRRVFLQRAVGWLIGLSGIAALSGTQDWPQNVKPTTLPVVKKHPVTPPGSGSRADFTACCTACQLCVSICPTQVLQPALFAYGGAGFLIPHMAYEVAYCTYECTRCGEVCPTGAIQRLSEAQKKRTRIGLVHFIEENCIVVTEQTACGACAEHCPTKAVRMVPYEGELTLPELDTEVCIGCGACEHPCPVRPHRAIYVDGEPLHQVADPPREQALKFEPGEGFPF